MSLAMVHSRAQVGMDAVPVSIEVYLADYSPAMSIVGLPEAAVKESKDRVRSALLNSRYNFPEQHCTVNLAPADLPKEGGRFDLPIALGILAASKQIPLDDLDHYEFIGELALSGQLRAIRGVLPVALAVREQGRSLILPLENAEEASHVSGLTILPAEHLLDVCAHLSKRQLLSSYTSIGSSSTAVSYPDMKDVIGQHHAKRALEVAACGGHNLLLSGSPGTGKTMLANRLPGILPDMLESEALASASIWSITPQGFDPDQWRQRPFRSPHHTASGVALVGGGAHPRPGEISLAHHGILFLDELPEFSHQVLEVLREPLESGKICISRANHKATFPAHFQLVAAMNPCPCGYAGDPSGRCHCSQDKVLRYRGKISGPLLDRIDLHVHVPNIPRQQRHDKQQRESSQQIRDRVVIARQRQLQRQGTTNHAMGNAQIEQHCILSAADEALLDQAIDRLGLSARSWHRLLKISRSIADLAASDQISTAHLSEAIGYRQLDRAMPTKH